MSASETIISIKNFLAGICLFSFASRVAFVGRRMPLSGAPGKTLAPFVLILAAMCAMVVTRGAAKDLPSPGKISTILVTELPKEGRDTLQLIHKGGPFPYAKDGVVFSNREIILPRQPRGYYHEYTVKTPGARNRGALRIVCGGENPPTCYFSDDHYQSFKKIKE